MNERAAHWHAEAIDNVLVRMGTAVDGLDNEEAARRLARLGPNRLSPSPPASAVRILIDQFKSIVIALLAAAIAVSVLTGDYLDAVAVACVLLINTIIGFVTEIRARRAMEALLQFDLPLASVVRSSRLSVIPSHELVPGDIIEVNAGQHVPADARLIDAVDLQTMEAALTGESMPVAKTSADVLPVDTLLAERSNVIYKGTTVASGTARAVVTATGAATEVGRIGTLVASVLEERTPLERRLDALGRRLVWLALAVAAVVAALGAWHGGELALVLTTGIALAVAAVPEALPAVATISLAVGLRRMARRHALVRRLPAVEALGSTTVICTDKTRTLTSGEMSVVRVWTTGRAFDLDTPDGGPSAPGPLRHAFEVAALASRPQANSPQGAGATGDPVDLAMLAAAAKAGVDREAILEKRPIVTTLPFSSRRKLMASFLRVDAAVVAYVKGAPQTVIALCDRAAEGDRDSMLDDDGRHKLLDVNASLAASGLRVIALAAGVVSTSDESALRALTFVGFVGLMDPPAPGVKDTIDRLRVAGLRTVMLTGDQRLTAEAIGRQLGTLPPGARVADGRDLDAWSEAEFVDAVSSVGAFSRVSPEHKLKIVRALQARGEIVAMIGDGVNDAAALKQADVGVAMGIRGTDVAKEAAAVVLQDDRFETITAAVEQGRIIYDNIRKFVFYLFSCNVAEVFVMLGAAIAGLPLPLLPLQILWLNLVTDTLPALALAMEPGEDGVMHRPPRSPQEALLSRAFLTGVLGYGLLIAASTMVGFVWVLDDPARAMTVCFMTLTLAQIFHLGNARSLDPVLKPARIIANPYAVGAVVISVALQLAAMYVKPLAAMLHVEPLGRGDWMLVIGLALVPAIVGQAIKLGRALGGPGRNLARSADSSS